MIRSRIAILLMALATIEACAHDNRSQVPKYEPDCWHKLVAKRVESWRCNVNIASVSVLARTFPEDHGSRHLWYEFEPQEIVPVALAPKWNSQVATIDSSISSGAIAIVVKVHPSWNQAHTVSLRISLGDECLVDCKIRRSSDLIREPDFDEIGSAPRRVSGLAEVFRNHESGLLSVRADIFEIVANGPQVRVVGSYVVILTDVPTD